MTVTKNESGLEQWQVSNNKVSTIHRNEILEQFSEISTKKSKEIEGGVHSICEGDYVSSYCLQ